MKTKFSIYIILSIFLFASTLTSCDDYLEMEKEGKIDQADYYKNDAFVSTSILAAYDILQSLYAQDWGSPWLIKSMVSDEILAGGSNATDQPELQSMNSFAHTPSNAHSYLVYRQLYAGIFRCNTVLANVAPESDVKKRVIAEAKCLRAYYNFELVTLFANVPLVTSLLESSENPSPATPAEIWAKIEQDFTEAIVDLPPKLNMTSADAYRVSRETARALLGKSLLYQEKYDAAAVQFDSVYESAQDGAFSLASDFSQILRISTEFGSESLFEVPYITTEGHTWANGTFPWGNGRRQENNIIWQLCGPRGDGYFDGGNTGLINGWGFANPRAYMWDVFTDAGDLERRASSIMSEDQLKAANGKLRNDGGELPYKNEGYVRLKYGTWAAETDVSTQAELNYGTNYRIIRYADVLLMGAEAHNRANTPDDAQALTYINEVRGRVHLDPLTSGGDELFEDIVSERQRELAFEGSRFPDLVRWGKAEQYLGSLGYLAKHALFPIPADELAVNPNMSQNPGW